MATDIAFAANAGIEITADGIGDAGSSPLTILAFDDATLIDDAKLGVLAASVIAAAVGATLLARQRVTDQAAPPPPEPADRA